jgi:dienelactone hydrolase
MGKLLPYCHGAQRLEGYLAALPSAVGVPSVVIVPSWLNVTESICRRADRIAELGYAAFVLDIFGAGIRPKPPQLPFQIIKPFLNDRLFFRRRLLAGLEAFYRQPESSPTNVAAIGFCLGGCGVLELARSGADLRGVVSLHGILNSPLAVKPGAIKSKILVVHGDEDPVVSLDEVVAFRNEMRLARANWEIVIYGDAQHGFTGEGVPGDGAPGAAFHPQSEERSWNATIAFLNEVLEKPDTRSLP